METNLALPPSLLIVDDEPDILFTLKKSFSTKEYRVETAANGSEAIECLQRESFQLMILDLNMAPVTGLEVLKSLRRENKETVVIILTAFSTLESAIESIHLGAYDYLVKPVDIDHIRRRVVEGLKQYERNHLLSLQQLNQSANNPEFLHAGDFTLDLSKRTAVVAGKALNLTTIEFKLLLCLVSAAPKPVSPEQLVKSAMGYDCLRVEAAGIIKFHIHHLRKKIEPDPLKPRHIKTIRFEGYFWCD